jgi:thiamine-phosphate pyrophosphorylase
VEIFPPPFFIPERRPLNKTGQPFRVFRVFRGYIVPMKPLADCRLYAFIDAAYFHGRAPEVFAQQLCDGGADLIQLRAKKSTPDEIRLMAEKILPITRRANVGLVINDHLDIARDTGAEFCHLGQEDFFDAGHTHVSQLKIQDSKLRIGLSTHSPEQAQRALAAEPAYIAIGPVFATVTKPMAKPVTLEYVRWAAAPQNGVTLPWFAIGGITLGNLDDVLAAGATRICVVSAILNAQNVAKACAEFRQRLG